MQTLIYTNRLNKQMVLNKNFNIMCKNVFIGSASTLEKVLNEVRTLQAEHKLMKIKITELESTVAGKQS